jgi:peptidyl-prolyl cis-trans isomerase A (cyclophilin A)
VVSCAEENVLCYPNDPYSTENILIHEFAHAIHGTAGQALGADFDKRLRAAYENAKETGLFKDTYAGSNASEYWAEAVQDWFDDNRQNDSLHNHVNTRAELKEYDPQLAELVAEVLGDIEVELDAEKAPITTKNFLRYTLDGFCADGSFHRTVTQANQAADDVKIEVIQASADPAREKDFFTSITLERTRDTGLRHVDGAISMARDEPDTAQDQFFICVGDQPELDFGGKRNPDGQGFAAFGRVIRGMDVVRKIHQLPADGQKLTSPVLIQRAVCTK